MDDTDLTDRLRRLGTEPLSPGTRADHHQRMTAASATRLRPERRFGRVAVGLAAVVGFLAGSTGLAVAGALPGPAQGVAHEVLGLMQVEVPDGNRGQCVSQAARGAATEEARATAKEACPKGGPPDKGAEGAPGRSGQAPGRDGKPGARGANPHADDDCRGRPPWAGDRVMAPEAKELLQAARAACPPDDDAGD
ncbi:MAG TPA: hypothetical protein VMN58_12465 [Acidimicrobiales bacterium]|nr:hypothetical protein [Acidimicrobiales bacterium]